MERYFSGAPWEKKVAYCRAVKAGSVIYVSGTAPVNDDGTTHAPGDPYSQARRCFEIIEKALAQFDCPISSVVRTRMYVTDIQLWREFGRAHEEVFRDFPPTTSMVEVKGLIDPGMLIEVEAEACC